MSSSNADRSRGTADADGSPTDGDALFTFGESMLRFSPAPHERIETADSFDVYVGGAESNVAVVAARFGVRSAWASKLPDTPLGRRVVADLRSHGVDPVVTWSDAGRTGTYYAEVGGAPRGTDVVYDREATAVRTASPADLAVERASDAAVVHTSGITPALSETLAASTEAVLSAAAASDATVSFDVNYRSKLWSPDAARDTLPDLLGAADVLTLALRDAREVLGLDGEPGDVASELAAEYGARTVLVTLSDAGALAYHDGVVYEQDAFEADVYDAVGTGDAFVGAFLAGRMRGRSVERALAEGTAAAALKCTIGGDAAVVRPGEVAALVESGAGDIRR